jgi:predicted dehydrogenase
MSDPVIRLGVIGCGYGAQVLVPAFRADSRVEVVAIAARSPGRAEATAAELGIPRFFDDWRLMLNPALLDAVAIAAPPEVQHAIAMAAFSAGLHVFAEKPLAMSLDQAREMARAAAASGRAHAIDFNFRGVAALRAARDLLRCGAIGTLRHVAVTWQVENYANRVRLESWKTNQGAGGGALGNFVSHSLDYLEWFAGKVTGLSARLAGMPGDTRDNDAFVSLALQFASGAAGSLLMSAAAYRGSGHKIEFYGEDGTLVLDNPGTDYMRGFALRLAKRPDDFADMSLPAEADNWQDGRVLPASRIARHLLDWAERGETAGPNFAGPNFAGPNFAGPNFADGLRVQYLMDAARRSHAGGVWVGVEGVKS